MSTATNTVFETLNRVLENNDIFEIITLADKTLLSKKNSQNLSHPPSQGLSKNRSQQLPRQEDSTSTNSKNKTIVGYLTPVHPFLIQIVEQNESEYLKNLTAKQLSQLFDQLKKNGTSYIVFCNHSKIPGVFLNQKSINIIRAKKTITPFSYLFNATKHIPKEQISIHSSVAVIFNQGILITGDSGTGKSSLLLSLIDRGHLWVADDAPHIYLNQLNEIYAASDEAISLNGDNDFDSPPPHNTNLNPNPDPSPNKKEYSMSAFIHTKNTGIINADQTYGKSKRITRHRLAAIIHLGDNARTDHSNNENLSGYQMVKIFEQSLPKWTVASQQENIAIFVECIAKQLILNSWGNNAADALTSTHNSFLNSAAKNKA